MVSRSGLLLLTAALLFGGPSLALAADDKTPTTTACTAISTKGGSFFDLRPDIAVAKKDGKHQQRASTEDYTVKGYDYNYNFTLNICEAVLKTPESIVGVDESLYRNVSAYYTANNGRVYSIGQQNATLTPRGSQLVLQYSNGSPCGPSSSSSISRRAAAVHEGAAYKDYIDEDVSYGSSAKSGSSGSSSGSGSSYTSSLDTVTIAKDDTRRKSATIAFRCDRDSVSSTPVISFVGADPDECNYVFVVRSQHACAGVEPHKPGSVGPGGVFAIIMIIAIIVYFAGGMFYQRNVVNARGWRQLPNYTFWAGIWSFITDFFVILTSSCARFLPSHRGYHSLSRSPNGRGMGRSREDEDRLIGQLDEEWDD
ncbi:mannose 6-phosphate receptor domain-containing protein [Cryphonectria parasitica EP155]|uniref:Mannose 6-phosphate receptor domain-containing protein n=1 Tax=Cryphonectria parasitica (strain ATCC 38755 / EP155) TaxID=660469 RepID=A0A9P5CSQ4_CRYP1|nr:mannose 6-phosphate receptor domain-containing protein [Cryphonectria parasitica EP155]KAF3769518.1 mannose 6-phosphate receptor domain-containing protein [Cryphonectria parasitica EP155]